MLAHLRDMVGARSARHRLRKPVALHAGQTFRNAQIVIDGPPLRDADLANHGQERGAGAQRLLVHALVLLDLRQQLRSDLFEPLGDDARLAPLDRAPREKRSRKPEREDEKRDRSRTRDSSEHPREAPPLPCIAPVGRDLPFCLCA